MEDAPERFVAGQLRAIVGVEVGIERVVAKAKLSQNRPAADVDGVIAGLRSVGDDRGADAVVAHRPDTCHDRALSWRSANPDPRVCSLTTTWAGGSGGSRARWRPPSSRGRPGRRPRTWWAAGRPSSRPRSPSQFVGTYDRGAGTREFTDRLGAPPDGGTGALDPEHAVGRRQDPVRHPRPLRPARAVLGHELLDPAGPGLSSGPAPLPSFQIAVDINGGDLQPRDLYLLTFVPSRGGDEWTKQDAGSGRWCVTRQDGGLDAYRAGCATGERRTIAEIVQEHPGVSALAAGVNQGGGNEGLVAAVDLVHAGSTTYDLEPPRLTVPRTGRRYGRIDVRHSRLAGPGEDAREHPDRDDRVPGRGASAAAADDPLDLLEQGHLPARADLQRLRRAGQGAPGRLPGEGSRRRHVGPARRARPGRRGPHAHRPGQRHRHEPRRRRRPDRHDREVRHRRAAGPAQGLGLGGVARR